MAIKHVSGDFFDGSHDREHAAFGFHGSLKPLSTTAEKPQRMDFADTHGSKHRPEPTEEHEGGVHDYAHGGGVSGHPHGEHIVHTVAGIASITLTAM